MITPAIRLQVAAVILLLSCVAQAAPPTYTLQTGIGNDDSGEDTELFYYLGGSALFSKALSFRSIIDFKAELSILEYPDEDDISGDQIFLEAVYSYTPRAGFRVPSYSIGLRLIEDDLADNEFDSTESVLILSVSYRLDDRNSLLGGVKFSDLDSGNDRTRNSLFATLDHKLNPNWLLYTTLEYAEDDTDNDGGISANPGGSLVARNDFSGHHLPIYAARDGNQNITFLTFGASYRISALNRLDLSYSHREFDDDSGAVYSVDFFHRF